MKAKGNTIKDDVDWVVVCYLDIDIESICIIQLFLYSGCLFKIIDLIQSSIWLIVVVIFFCNGVLDLICSIESVLVRVLLF